MRFVSKITKLAILMAAFAVFFTSCQKEDKLDVAPLANTKTTIIDYNKTYKVEKGATVVKPGSVYVMDSLGNFILHRTLKIRNISWSYAQEWFLDDLTTGIYYPGSDPTITPMPKYFSWGGDEIQSAVDNGDFSNIIATDATGQTLVAGFHLPKIDSNNPSQSDIDKLGAALGSTASIRTKLQLNYGGCRFWSPAFSTSQACIWLECRNTSYAPNIVSGCGVVGVWNLPNDSFGLYFTNIPKTQTRVRLVRNITQAQW